MTPAELFTRCGRALCGDGPKWKEQLAGMLRLKTNSVDNMSKGDSRIPAGVWLDIQGLLQDRYTQVFPRLINDVDDMRTSAEVNPAPDGRQTVVTSGPRRRP